MTNLNPSIVRCPWESFKLKAQLINELSCDRLHIDISFEPCDNWLIYYKDFTTEDRSLFHASADFHLFNFENTDIDLAREVIFPLIQKNDSVILHLDNDSDHCTIRRYVNMFKLGNISTWIALDINNRPEILYEYMESISKILIMWIPKWTYKQSLDISVFEKRNEIINCNLIHWKNIHIWLDGWVTEGNIIQLKQIFDFVVIGSVLFSDANIPLKWINLKKI